MTPEAFRFYIPAYLSIVIKEFEKSDVLPLNTVLALTSPIEVNKLDKFNLMQSHPIIGNFIERISGFNQQQCQAIRYYLEYLNIEKKNYFINNESQVAIERYWFIFPL